ncbi:hypothetical protein [Duncaniella freteri]|uniref:hypothetical protein n=1 Tax=Duncaniella freteri TaxID=2530391 RepID=UPI00256FF635|nr:hypothetical protein [Duncaniella freteri]
MFPSCHPTCPKGSRAVIPFPLSSTLHDRSRVLRCHNLRPDPTGGLMGVSRPATISSLPGAEPVKGGLITLDDGTRCIIMYHHGHLKAVTDTEIKSIIRLDEAPATVTRTAGSLIVMRHRGTPLLIPLDTLVPAGHLNGTVITLTRQDMTAVSADIPAVTLKGSYDTSSRTLCDADRTTLDKGMRDAYLRLCDLARLQRRYIQPVVARYRLIGDGGDVIYTSAPVLISPESGLQATHASILLTGEGFRQMSGARLTATGYTVGITYSRTPDAEWLSRVRSVEVLVSPQLHPLVTGLPGTFTRTGSSTTQLTFTHTLPGVNPLDDPGSSSSRLTRCITSIIDNADTTLRSSPAEDDTSEEMARLQSIISIPSTPPPPDSIMRVRLSPPNTFTAGCTARSGDLIAWGNLTAIPFDGYTLPEMSAKVIASESSTPTAVQVTMQDGSTVVSQTVVHKQSVTSLSPLLVYPNPDARLITLIAGRRSVTLPLTPSPCGRWAYYLSPTLAPVTFTDDTEGFVSPPSSPSLRRYPSGIAITTESSPLTPTAVSAGDASVIHSLLPSMRHSSSFTVPAARFYTLGTGGISSMTLTDRRTRINMNLLDSRGITDHRAATPIPGGIAAITGDRLIAITGSRQSSTILEECPSGMLGWDDSRGELWIVPYGDEPTLVTTLDGKTLYTRSSSGASSLLSSLQSLILVTSEGELLDTAKEDEPSVCRARYTVTLPHTFAPGSHAMLYLPIYGESMRGTISLSASHHRPDTPVSAATLPHLLTLTINGGSLRHPLTGSLRIPHSHHLTLDIDINSESPHTIRIRHTPS